MGKPHRRRKVVCLERTLEFGDIRARLGDKILQYLVPVGLLRGNIEKYLGIQNL